MADNIAVTNTSLAALNIGYPVTANAATATVANETQKFVITPNKRDDKTLVRITVGPTNGAVAFSIAAGDFWMGIAAQTGSVAQATSEVIEIESAKYMKSDGTIEITFTPASGKILLTDHALSVEVYSMV
jgi:hypothetical protein